MSEPRTDQTYTVKDVLCQTLKDLGKKDFNDFKWYLKEVTKIPEADLEAADVLDTVNLMVGCEPQRALETAVTCLESINRRDLAHSLSQSNPEGGNISQTAESGYKGLNSSSSSSSSHLSWPPATVIVLPVVTVLTAGADQMTADTKNKEMEVNTLKTDMMNLQTDLMNPQTNQINLQVEVNNLPTDMKNLQTDQRKQQMDLDKLKDVMSEECFKCQDITRST
ncbi:uncharacterized protein LOC120570160 isoform X2 [Perca fluviatilis]|uniref:uncharacterized protein LOC120570160 isoform X2 n=2 Tax=Perca fluviatilis TaxID=8168 RepID=UPI00196263F7|nr:uncharacterized protein LOC120570160 isoform X2 [Perca fluviatilis]